MQQNQTILFITSSLLEGGAGKMVHHIAGVLAKEYEKVYAVAVNHEKIVNVSDNVHYLTPLNEHNGGILGFIRTIRSIRRVVKEVRPNLVITFVADLAFCTRVATLEIKNITVVSAERGNPYSYNLIWRLLIPWAFRKSDYCFFQLEKARIYYGERVANKSFVIPNAAFYSGEVACHRCVRKTIVSAGRFVEEKGYCYLIDAFKTIYEKHPDYSLIIYGSGPYLEAYQEQVNALGLAKAVSFPGYTRDVCSAFKNEDIFVLPSLSEGIPNVLIEALLTGIPTVSTDCPPGGPNFLTNYGKRGLLVPIADSQSISDSVLRLIEDRNLYCLLEQEGPKVEEELNPRIIEEKWIEAFRKITG